MGDAADEARALQELEQRRTAELLRIEAEREAARQAAEEAAKQQGNMVADPGVSGALWPDNEAQAPQTGLGKVAGALGVGRAGDVALAQRLLNSGQAPLGGVSTTSQATDGAQENAGGARAAKPALGLG